MVKYGGPSDVKAEVLKRNVTGCGGHMISSARLDARRAQASVALYLISP